MEKYRMIKSPEIFRIVDKDGRMYYGANQIWYPTHWQRQSGCGPTNSSHLLWYLSRTRREYRNLAEMNGNEKTGFIQLMENVWEYVMPGKMGVNSTGLLTEGIIKYAESKGVKLSCDILDVPLRGVKRPDFETVRHFLTGAFDEDLPVVFLNLSNGRLNNLDTWHWVTLVAVSEDSNTALMYDQGNKVEIDLKRWLHTTALGGGFVKIY